MAPRTPRPAGARLMRAKPNPLKTAGLVEDDGSFFVDYKDVNLLRRFISDRGRIRSRRTTGLTPRQQRAVAVAIKNAREMALLPYGPPRDTARSTPGEREKVS